MTLAPTHPRQLRKHHSGSWPAKTARLESDKQRAPTHFIHGTSRRARMSRSSDTSRRPRSTCSVAKDFMNPHNTARMTADSHFFKLGAELGLPISTFYHLSAIPCRFFNLILIPVFNSLASSITTSILITFDFLFDFCFKPKQIPGFSKSATCARVSAMR